VLRARRVLAARFVDEAGRRALRSEVLQAAAGAQAGPQSAAQQFSVRNASSAFIASKSAA
jgi:hypothetical protein